MSWSLKKEKARDTQLNELKTKVDVVETRVNAITDVLIEKIEDPWAQAILRSIHERE